MIAISAHVYDEEVQSYLAAGFDGYLPKPLDKDALCHMINSSLQGHSLVLEQSDLEPNYQPVSSHIIDVSVVSKDSLILGNEKMKEIITLFDKSADETLNLMQTAAEQDDPNQIKQLAHKLKGSAGSLGLLALFDACLDIEKSQQPVSDYLADKDQLLSLIEISKQALNQLVD